jgi:adenylate cyclase
MVSLIHGYEYDIFISYRHKDNKYDGWVSDFVSNLRKELEATFKEDISIYFDENPHDGLLETHDVDKSLGKKLKCLVFIPILSQTYCDPKSFAWKDEFVAFVKGAKEDQLGLDVNLLNGNVCSRILPVQIHELDPEDKEMIQSETGSVLRSIEFIYKAPGVKRPLLPREENPSGNINKTSYRDQLNKVANSIKEILTAIRHEPVKTVRQDRESFIDKIPNSSSKKKISVGILSLLIIAAIVSGVLQFLPSNEEAEIEKSIAVLPFDDMSPGKDQGYLGDGIAEEVITALSRIKDLKVIGRTSSFQFKGDKVDLREVGEKLDVAAVLEGSVQKAGNNVRITAQLIRVSDGSHIWSERFDRDITDIFAIQDEISTHIAEKLKLTLFKTSSAPTENLPTKNMEAYEMLLKGNHFLRQGPKGRENAISYFQQAIDLDSTYADAYIGLAWGHFFEFKNSRAWLGSVRRAVKNALDHHVEEERVSELMVGVYMYEWNWTAAEREYDKWFASNAEGTVAHAVYLRMAHADFQKAMDMLKSIVRKDPLNVEALRMLGYSFTDARQYDEARRVHRNILEIDPAYSDAYLSIGFNYFLEGNYKLAFENYDIAEKMQPGKSRLLRILTLAYDNQKMEALKAYQEYKEQYPDNNTFQAAILFALGDVNEAFGQLEIAYGRREPHLVYLRTYPPFDPYRTDKRFQALMQKINFPEK